jgi:hypothetical protein
MPIVQVKAPDGSILQVNAPDGATDDQILGFAASQWKPAAQPQPQTSPSQQGDGYIQNLINQDQSNVDYSSDLLKNIPGSGLNLAMGLGNAVMHPLNTAQGLWDVAAGELHKIVPQSVSNAIDAVAPSDATQRAVNTATNVNDIYSQRYGGLSNIGNTIKTDPLGVAADVSAMTGGAGLLSRGTKLGQTLQSVSSATNPLNAVSLVTKPATDLAGWAGKTLLGLSTGVGPENIGQAAKAGFEGNSAYYNNLTGQVPMTDVLETAKQNLARMAAQRSNAYQTGMQGVNADSSILNFQPIIDSVKSVQSRGMFGNKVIKPSTVETGQQISQMVEDWRNSDPALYHTAAGLDALKQAVGDVRDSTAFGTPSRNVADSVYNAIKGEIVKQAPDYAKTMSGYQAASDTLHELQDAFQLKEGKSVDSAMRRLQSLARNNVNTNYSNRLSLAQQLEQEGGQEILPSIAGQAMNTWGGRGLTGNAINAGTLGYALHNPLAVALLPFESPKAMGYALYGGGRLAGGAANLLGKVATPEQAKLAAILAAQSGKVAQ